MRTCLCAIKFDSTGCIVVHRPKPTDLNASRLTDYPKSRSASWPDKILFGFLQCLRGKWTERPFSEKSDSKQGLPSERCRMSSSSSSGINVLAWLKMSSQLALLVLVYCRNNVLWPIWPIEFWSLFLHCKRAKCQACFVKLYRRCICTSKKWPASRGQATFSDASLLLLRLNLSDAKHWTNRLLASVYFSWVINDNPIFKQISSFFVAGALCKFDPFEMMSEEEWGPQMGPPGDRPSAEFQWPFACWLASLSLLTRTPSILSPRNHLLLPEIDGSKQLSSIVLSMMSLDGTAFGFLQL